MMAATTRAATAITKGLDSSAATTIENECLYNDCAWNAILTLPANPRMSLMSFTSLDCRGANVGSNCTRSSFGYEVSHPYN
jgi:hypothetical protein